MSDDVAQSPSATPPPVALLQMMTGYMISKAIYVAAKLGIADHLVDGPASAEDLAAATGADAPSLYRVLRALASVGIFTETTDGHFALTPLASLLRSGTPDSLRALAMTYNEEMYRVWGDMLYTVRTGTPAWEREIGMPVFEFFDTHPEASAIFNEAMVGWTHQLTDAVIAAYDFSPFATVVDVGGGFGALLAAILQHYPSARGILFDLPRVVEGAEGFLKVQGVADRCTRVGGDFFATAPVGGDAYILAQILHDWDDEHCVTILRQVRQAMPEQGKLLVVELVLPTEKNEPFFGKWLDLHMMVLLGARERTAEQYAALFRASGFVLSRVVPIATGQSVVEAIPV
jgi:O-methyltransferase domain/Dimerisation domain